MLSTLPSAGWNLSVASHLHALSSRRSSPWQQRWLWSSWPWIETNLWGERVKRLKQGIWAETEVNCKQSSDAEWQSLWQYWLFLPIHPPSWEPIVVKDQQTEAKCWRCVIPCLTSQEHCTSCLWFTWNQLRFRCCFQKSRHLWFHTSLTDG